MTVVEGSGDRRLNTRAFRTALGQFATGVTVVTARDATNGPVGLTCNSFNSVSLDPPLILWSLSKAARSLPVFQAVSHYAVNILSADQIELSRRFASPDDDKFDGLETRDGAGQAPLLPGCVAWFECHNAMSHDGGDHVIFVGEVERFARGEARAPLLYHGGQYGVPARHIDDLPRAAGGEAPFVDDYLLYLLARASHQVSTEFHAELRSLNVSVTEWRVLASLWGHEPMTVGDLARYCLFKQPTLTKTVDRLERRGHVARKASHEDRRKVRVYLTAKGRRATRRLIERARHHEDHVLADYSAVETDNLKATLRTLIVRSGD